MTTSYYEDPILLAETIGKFRYRRGWNILAKAAEDGKHVTFQIFDGKQEVSRLAASPAVAEIAALICVQMHGRMMAAAEAAKPSEALRDMLAAAARN